jgi:hypothetical protein
MADEIEKLRDEVEKLSAENGRLQKSVDVKREVRDCMLKSMLAKIDEVKKLTAENERLRAAADDLRQYVSRADYHHHVKDETKSALEGK